MTEHPAAQATTALPREASVAATFVMLADSLVSDYDVIDVLDRLVHTCVTLLDIDAAGMLLRDPAGGLVVAASSDEDTRLVEVFQTQNAEGPCRDCARQGEPVGSRDLRDDLDRWPQFVPLALGAGFRSVSAVPMRVRGDIVGALGLFGATVGELPTSDLDLAQAFADVATIGLLHNRTAHRSTVLAEQLRAALDSRVVIEQAKGVLAERNGSTMGQAYDHLRAHARNNNEKLTQVALSVVEDGLRLPAG